MCQLVQHVSIVFRLIDKILLFKIFLLEDIVLIV